MIATFEKIMEHRMGVFNIGRYGFLTLLAVSIYIIGGHTVAQAAQLVVFESHGTVMVPGQMIDDSAQIKLKDGQKLTLISNSGKVISLSGPFVGAPAPLLGKNKAGVFDALQTLVSKRESHSSALGVARSLGLSKSAFRSVADKPLPLPNPWMVDITTSGDWCYRTGDTIKLYHPQASKIKQVEITKLDEQWMGEIKWPSGLKSIAMPAEARVVDNAKFWFNVAGKDKLIAFRSVPKGIASKKAEAAWMMGKNCVHQARVLLGK